MITLVNFSDEQSDKVRKAINHIELVVSVGIYFDRLSQYKNRHGENKFTDYAGTPATASKVLQKGLSPLNATIKIYTSLNPWSKEIARYDGDGILNLNSRFFNRSLPNEIAGSIVHEFCHRLGFTHSYDNNLDRPDSFPYAAGRLMAYIFNEKVVVPTLWQRIKSFFSGEGNPKRCLS